MLQEHDGALDRLLHRRETLPERDTVAAGEAAIRRARRGDRVRSPSNATRSRTRRSASTTKRSSLREKAAEVEAKMYSGSVSSPRELQAMQADIDQLRRHERNLETRELELMEAREPLDSNLAELDAQRAALARRSRPRARRRSRVPRPRSTRRWPRSARLRDAIAGELEPTLVGDYERRRARARGVGVARLVGNTCQGCHLSIPATEVDSIRRAPEGTISYCDNCGCILVP